jgi:Fur family peroxide stress response transcriptional regulator
MDSLTTVPIADLLKQLFQTAEATDRPLFEAFSSEGEEFSQERFKTLLKNEAKDYKAVYRTYAGIHLAGCADVRGRLRIGLHFGNMAFVAKPPRYPSLARWGLQLTCSLTWYSLPDGNRMHSDEIAARLQQFEEICRQKGLPVTTQRRVILEAILERDDHPTADQIYDAVQDRIPQVSRTTVYRTIDTLLELGVIRRVHLTGVTGRFDGTIRRHHHLVCTQCDKIMDINDEDLDQLSLPKRKLQGFKVDDWSVQFVGTCAECQKKRK